MAREMNTQSAIKWLKTSLLAALGGGIAATVAGMMDPTKYHIPQDLFSGKLLPNFFAGVGLTFGGMLLRSPLGQSAMKAYQDSQQQLEQSKADLAEAKEELKAKRGGDASKAGKKTETGSKEKGPG